MINGSIFTKKAGETRAFSRSFSQKLATDESLTGTPTAEELGTTDLTIDDVDVSAVELVIAGLTVSTAQAVSFTVAGGTTRTEYTVRLTAETNGDPVQTLVEDVRIAIL